MGHNITETAEYTIGAIGLPNNGEGDGIESIEPAFQELMDRGALCLGGVEGILRGAEEFAVATGGAPNNFDITVGGVQSLVLADDAGDSYKGYFYISGSPAIDETKVEGGGGTLGASAQIWYLYVFPDGAGGLDFEVSTTAPRASRIHKTGAGYPNQSRRYLGAFPTDSSGNPLALRAVRGHHVFRDRAIDLHMNQSTAGINTFTSALSLAARIPPHARVVTVRMLVFRDNGGDSQVVIKVNGDTNAAGIFWAPALTGGLTPPFAQFDVEMDVGSAQQVQVSTSDTHTFINLDVAGWRE